MRKIIVSENISLDGFVAGPNGEMDWIHVDEDLFNYIVKLTNQADAAIYGRVTYEMMDAYWPTAATNPNASKHDVDHSEWYNRVNKIVLSSTIKEPKDKTQIISENLLQEILTLKAQSGKNILMFGSPSAANSLMELDLIDEYWLFINPILLGDGIPFFRNISKQKRLRLIESHIFSTGVIEMHFETTNNL